MHKSRLGALVIPEEKREAVFADFSAMRVGWPGSLRLFDRVARRFPVLGIREVVDFPVSPGDGAGA